MIITEMELREIWQKTEGRIIALPQGSVLTPLARDFIRSKELQIQLEDRAGTEVKKPLPSKNSQGHKPEQMTHLYQSELVSKNHSIIALRGQLDLFQTLLVDTQIDFQAMGKLELVERLEEVAALAREIMAAEVKRQPFAFKTLWGLTPDEIRERSHYPHKYYGVAHSPLSYKQGAAVSKLHQLRAKIREVELYANRAFTDGRGECGRVDLVQALNRLSSAFYILACEQQIKA
ncbi:ATP-binding protein [Desulfitobacterium chlororespirans]|uniref:Ethanolamine utilization cobalamin adenosyltransferase n=1 Tax=Desulfitobacterium chlororespirans DSM 11544 TaxID=1121395 RepID=A0A1M7TDX6_9FIRM|nr:ATP-binding protein [Desulfitobacterium chlororespirans]SHN68886.1 ethanolamine utilization cobalamin adenosyltransferase [Desulfitobacterium chlororespirans DSM 11544]